MATSEINYSSGTVVDLESDTVTPATLLEGETAHDATGASITGTMRTVPDSEKLGGLSASSYVNSVAKYYPVASYVEGGAGDVDAITDPFALVPIGTDKNVSLYEAFGNQGSFAYVHTWFYSTQSTETSRYQWAVIYSNSDQRFVFRIYHGGVWGEWTSTDNANKLGGKPPEYYLTPVNLLDNSDFRNPVNQRGQTSYTGSGYKIDRWRTNFSGDTVEVLSSGGVKNVVNSTETGWHLHQILTNCEWMEGKDFTAACKICEYVGSNIRFIVSFRNSANTEINNLNTPITDGVVVLSGTAPEGTAYVRVGLYAYSGVLPGDYVVVDWAALYEGLYTAETLPPYVPKENELAACLLYAIGLPDQMRLRVASVSANTLEVFIPLPCKMRNSGTLPTFDATAFEVRNTSQAAVDGFTFSVVSEGNNGILFRATKTAHGLTDGEIRTKVSTILSKDL